MKIECPNCHFTGESKRFTRGSFLAELFLWVIFFPVGIIYSLWRLSSKKDVCPQCRYDYVIRK